MVGIVISAVQLEWFFQTPRTLDHRRQHCAFVRTLWYGILWPPHCRPEGLHPTYGPSFSYLYNTVTGL